MKHTFLFLFVVLVFSSPVSAQITDPGALFTCMCITEKSTGLNWRSGNWEYTRFREAKYIIEKFLPEDFAPGVSLPKSGVCKGELKGHNSRYEEDIGFTYGCYNLREFGDPIYPLESQVCLETWIGKAPSRVLDQITCQNSFKPFAFAPDGWFHRALIHSNIESNPEIESKESMYVQVGKCAVIGK